MNEKYNYKDLVDKIPFCTLLFKQFKKVKPEPSYTYACNS